MSSLLPISAPADPAFAHLADGLGVLQEAAVCCCSEAVIRYVNDSAERFYGRSRDELVGQPVTILMRDPARDLACIGRTLAGEEVAPYDSCHHGAGGAPVDVGVGLSLLPGENGNALGVAFTIRDARERVATARELARTRDLLEAHATELERSNADLEQFAYVASHDLSEPLRTITGMLALLQEDYAGELGEDADEYIARAVAGAERLRALISALLIYSRVGRRSAEPSDLDLGVLVAEAVEALGDLVSVRHAEIRVPAPLPTLRVDPHGLRQVLQNLIANALKFNESTPPVVEITATREAAAWRIVVADNGIGIPDNLADRVFRPFKRLHTRDAYPGTGIGLAICKRIIERHGGTLAHEPGDGGGTRFHYTVPDDLPEIHTP